MNVDKANFESMLASAEMVEQWHHSRRQPFNSNRTYEIPIGSETNSTRRQT